MILKKEKISVNNKPAQLNMVKALSATIGDTPGEIDLQWDAVRDARSYIVQFCLITNSAKEEDWKHIDIVTESCCTVSGLKKGKIAGFRVALISDNGQSKWCRKVYKKIDN